MFTKEKLERWIELMSINIDLYYDTGNEELIDDAEDLKQTLEQIYTSMTSDGSI